MSRAPLLVLACGMATAVGLTAPASCAAIRARLDGFGETRFVARGGGWIVGAAAPLEEPWRGLPRLARLAAGPVRECLDAADGLSPEGIPLLLGVAEPDRPGRPEGLDARLLPMVEDALSLRFHPASRVVPMGRVAGAAALREAAKLVNRNGVARAVVAGVDSYLAAATLESFDERGRLLTEPNPNGFVPGEGAAAVLVGADDGGPGMKVRSLGLAVEKAAVESGEPLRGDGLTAAYRQALGTAGLAMAQVGYRMGTMSGEQYFFREAELATGRLLRGRHEFMDLWHPADCIGETGAAALPCCIALASVAARKGYAAGDPVLVSASGDDGRRAALLLAGPGVPG